MSYLRGEDINIGFGIEDPASRGTYVEPQIWVPGRSPAALISEPELVEIRETRITGMSAQDSEIVQKKSTGDFEFNLRVESFGFLVKSWLGGDVTTSGIESGVYEHTFIVGDDAQHPTLSAGLVLSQDYEYANTIVKSIAIRTPVDDVVNATANLLSPNETKRVGVAFAPTFDTKDYYFRHQDVTIKLADDEAGLDAADALCLKTFELSGDNNSRLNQCIGQIIPGDVLSLLQDMSIEFSADYLDETYRDLIIDGGQKALRIEMERSDIDYAGGNHPKITFDFPKVKLATRTQDRPIEDTVIDNCTARVFAAPTLKVVNERANYNHA